MDWKSCFLKVLKAFITRMNDVNENPIWPSAHPEIDSFYWKGINIANANPGFYYNNQCLIYVKVSTQDKSSGLFPVTECQIQAINCGILQKPIKSLGVNSLCKHQMNFMLLWHDLSILKKKPNIFMIQDLMVVLYPSRGPLSLSVP